MVSCQSAGASLSVGLFDCFCWCGKVRCLLVRYCRCCQSLLLVGGVTGWAFEPNAPVRRPWNVGFGLIYVRVIKCGTYEWRMFMEGLLRVCIVVAVAVVGSGL